MPSLGSLEASWAQDISENTVQHNKARTAKP